MKRLFVGFFDYQHINSDGLCSECVFLDKFQAVRIFPEFNLNSGIECRMPSQRFFFCFAMKTSFFKLNMQEVFKSFWKTPAESGNNKSMNFPKGAAFK